MEYIVFNSEKDITIEAPFSLWNGTIEYSYDSKTWSNWRGEAIINNVIYMRGVNNTKISNLYYSWMIRGINIKCQGNLENLLDYKSVINDVHPKMESECFAYMFVMCNLIEAPQLLSPTLSDLCYNNMFFGCKLLTISPMFPNLQIAKEAIINQEMLDNCSIQFININNKLYDINVLKLV